MFRMPLLIALGTIATAAQAGERGSGNFSVSAAVPEHCSIASDTLSINPNSGEARGTLSEFCNSSRGYQILASYRSLSQAEAVQLDFNGQPIQLDPSGQSHVAFRSGPRISQFPVAVRSTNLDASIAVSLSLTLY